MATKTVTHKRPQYLRFWTKVAITANPDKCWNWQSRAKIRGYGKIGWWVDSQWHTKLAHHVAWWLTYGKWPDDCLLHSCDNPLCCNPKHLREGTRADNAQDRVDRRRGYEGDTHPSSILTSTKVNTIRAKYKSGERICDLARFFHVSYGAVDSIVKNRTWKGLLII